MDEPYRKEMGSIHYIIPLLKYIDLGILPQKAQSRNLSYKVNSYLLNFRRKCSKTHSEKEWSHNLRIYWKSESISNYF